MIKVGQLTDIPPVRDYLMRIGAEPRSLRTAVVKELKGAYWKDTAIIHFSPGGSVNCSSVEHAPTELEISAIGSVWGQYSFPQIKLLRNIIDAPETVKRAKASDLFEFRDPSGEFILMLQVRMTQKGTRAYLPWTYWDDDVWRMSEPEGHLPLWGLDQLSHHKTVFIHEGAKAARYCRWLTEAKDDAARKALADHPWGAELCGAAHLGWIGGALSPMRTDWSVLAKHGVDRAYIVADNDVPGKHSISAVSRQLRTTTFSVEFSGRFPASFDLADKFPEEMYSDVGGQRFYIGPTLRDLLQPATWATDQVPNPTGKGRPLTVLREEFGCMWAYVEEADAFVCTEMPSIMRSEAIFNKIVSPFSHLQETSKLLLRNYKGRSAKVCYRPDSLARLIDHKGSNAINLHVPPSLKPGKGDPEPWLDFLRYMFVNDEERRSVERWCATLIARPEIRIGYGLLLISETQGVGKTTLGSTILAPLVGHHNVSYPGENDITSTFNEWVANKRLAIVNEIYSGSSWRAYHALKSIITDQEVSVNQKYMRAYTTDNWCHVLACSNSMRALKMEMDDRRWYYPELVEVPWPGSKFKTLRKWLQGGGLSIVRGWAENYGDYVEPSERAPMTERKREMIEGSRSEGQRATAALAEMVKDRETPVGFLMREVTDWTRATITGRLFDTEYELRRAMVEVGMFVWPKRVKVGGWLQYVIMNDALYRLAINSDDANLTIRQSLLKPEAVVEPEL